MKRSDLSTRDILRAVVISKFNEINTIDFIVKEYKAPEKVALRALEREHDKGFIEYGVNIGRSWLTEDGEAFLNKHSI